MQYADRTPLAWSDNMDSRAERKPCHLRPFSNK